jgi:hypothetical protein
MTAPAIKAAPILDARTILNIETSLFIFLFETHDKAWSGQHGLPDQRGQFSMPAAPCHPHNMAGNENTVSSECRVRMAPDARPNQLS